MNSQSMAKGMLDLLKDKSEMEAKLKEMNKQIFVSSQELYDLMEQENVEKINIEGIDFKPDVALDFSITDESAPQGIKWDDYPEWFNWLKSRGDGDLIKTKETVAWNTRRKYLKELIEKGEQLPAWITEQWTNTVKYNKSAIARLVNEERNK